MQQMQNTSLKFTLGAMRGLTWDDLACLFLGFEEEPLLSDKKNPDILFLQPRVDWAGAPVLYSTDYLIGQFDQTNHKAPFIAYSSGKLESSESGRRESYLYLTRQKFKTRRRSKMAAHEIQKEFDKSSKTKASGKPMTRNIFILCVDCVSCMRGTP